MIRVPVNRVVLLLSILGSVALLAACGSSFQLARLPAAPPVRNALVYAKVGPTGVNRVAPKRIWVAAPNGEHRRLLTYGDWPAVSPDGRYVAYFDSSGKKLLVIPTAGGKPTAVGSADDEPIWAPNSRFLALEGSSRVVVVDVQTGKQLRAIASACGFAFSPSSQRIAYTSDDDGSCDGDLYVVPTSGGSPVRLTDDHETSALGVAWGRPGIAFFRYTPASGGEGDIWLTDGRKHDARRLTHEGGAFGPNVPVYFSTNGRELLAAGDAVHTATVWAVDLPSGDVRQLNGIGYYTVPLGLSRDGTTVLAAATTNYITPDSWLETIPFAGGKPHIMTRGPSSASWTVR